MKNSLNLIVMLTHNDKTAMNAYDIFEQCKTSKAKFFGFKEKPLPLSKMKELYKYRRNVIKKRFWKLFRILRVRELKAPKWQWNVEFIF